MNFLKTTNNYSIPVQTLLMEKFGLRESLFLKQVHYWLSNPKCQGCMHEDKKWIYNTEEAWAEQLKFSTRSVRRYVSKFKKLGILLVEKLSWNRSIRTNYITICWEKLLEILGIGAEEKNDYSPPNPDDLALPSGQDGPLYIQILQTNKINKSEVYPQEQNPCVISYDQVNQVQNIIKFDEGRKDLAPRDPPNTTSQDMLSIWNEVLGHKSKAVMSKDLATWLVAAFNQKFNKEQVKWRSYCQMIASSSYMMSDSFDLEIQWALKFSTINKIFEGNLGVKYKDGIAKNAEIKHTIERGIESIDEPLEIKELRRKISESIGSAEYYSWFHPATFSKENGKIKITAQNPYAERIWNERYVNVLEELVGRGGF